MNENIYTVKKGEKFPIHIKVKNRDEDAPIDLTNAIIKFQLKDELKDEFCVIDKIITTETDVYSIGRIVSPKEGEFIVRFDDEDYDKLVVNRIYYLTIWWEIPDENFSKVISSNCNDFFKFMVCHP